MLSSAAACCLALLLAAAPLAAQKVPENVKRGSSKIKKAPEKEYARFMLPNGLEVLVVENHLVPIATIELAVRNGSFTEGPEFAGLSHLYEHMFFKGNATYPSASDFLGQLGALGTSLGYLANAGTQTEVVNYYFTIPIENLEAGMELMSIAAQTPKFDSLELEREREVVLGEFDRQESNPFFEFGRATDVALWGDLVTRKQPLGQRPVIKTATPEKMRAIQQKYYIPNNSLLIVAGDVDSVKVRELAMKYFSGWKRGADPFAKNPPPRPAPLKEKKLITVPAPGVELSQITYQWHGPSIGIDDEATYAADVFIFILEQPQSRFQRKLVESGIAQGAGINYFTQRYVGPISVVVATTPDATRRALDVVWDEIQAFDSPDYFTDEELETAKAKLRMRALYDSETTSEFIHTLGFWWSTAGIDYYRSYVDNLSKVTRADIQKYVRNYIKGKNYVLGVSTNKEALAAMNLNASEVLR